GSHFTPPAFAPGLGAAPAGSMPSIIAMTARLHDSNIFRDLMRTPRARIRELSPNDPAVRQHDADQAAAPFAGIAHGMERDHHLHTHLDRVGQPSAADQQVLTAELDPPTFRSAVRRRDIDEEPRVGIRVLHLADRPADPNL